MKMKMETVLVVGALGAVWYTVTRAGEALDTITGFAEETGSGLGLGLYDWINGSNAGLTDEGGKFTPPGG